MGSWNFLTMKSFDKDNILNCFFKQPVTLSEC